MVHFNFKSNDEDVIEYLKDKNNKSKAVVEAIKLKRYHEITNKKPVVRVKI